MTQKNLSCDILIAGAGIAGSALACALRDRGYSVVQVEMSDRPLDTARGDHFQCVVADILDRWGALPAFWAAGAEKRHAALYVTETGAPLLDVDYSTLPIPHPYYIYLHHELLGETFLKLAAENPNYVLFRPARAREYDVGPEGVRSLTINLSQDAPAPEGFAPGDTVTIVPRLAVGADGRTSRAREALGFTYDEHEYDNPIVALFGPRLPSDDDPRNTLTSFLGPNGSISRIPRAFGGWKVGTTIRKADIAFWKTATLKMRKAAVAKLAPELEALDLEVGGFYPVKLLNTHKWVRGNAVLVGDACHAMHPARGQGMNVAIRCLDKLVNLLPDPKEIADPETVAKRLRAYESGVKPAIDKVLADNHARGQAYDSHDPAVVAESIEMFKAIQQDPERLRTYRMGSAGYADPISSAAAG
ncbi:MAG: FAD-dependent monooxygenase [Rhodobacteraceae bacterium]|nr:FAD-dependent monooxygenase [Paracoccaceae bacterium]